MKCTKINSLILLILLILCSCNSEKSTEILTPNHQPVITGLWSNPGSPLYLYYNDSTTLYVTADDVDGDELSYSWDGENFSATGQSVYWEYPYSGPEVNALNTHNQTIRIDVTDGNSEPIRDWITLEIIGEGVDIVTKYPTYPLTPGMTYSLIPVIDFNDSRYGTIIFKCQLAHYSNAITPLYEETVSLGTGLHRNIQLQGIQDFIIPQEWSGWDISIRVIMYEPNGYIEFSWAASDYWHIQ
jgi:hypothetical protein